MFAIASPWNPEVRLFATLELSGFRASALRKFRTTEPRNDTAPGLTERGRCEMSYIDNPGENPMNDGSRRPLSREQRERLYAQRWREHNQDHIRAYRQQYNEEHREYLNKYEQERLRARKAEAIAADKRRAKARTDYAANRDHRLAQQAMNSSAREARDPERFRAQRAATNARYNAAHRDELTQRQRRERLHKPDKVSQYNKSYRQRNAAAVREQAGKYYQINKDEINARARHKRALAVKRRNAGLPEPKLRRRAQGERAANILAADAFFARIWSQPELRHIQHREAWRLITSLHQAKTRDRDTQLAPPREPTERELEDARLDAIARQINNRLRTNRLRTNRRTSPIAPPAAGRTIIR